MSYSAINITSIHSITKQMSLRSSKPLFFLMEDVSTIQLLNMQRIPATFRSYNIATIYIKENHSYKYKTYERLLGVGQKYYQFRREYHHVLDSAIVVFSEFAYAYREKEAPHVKSENFIEWKRLIDKAVLHLIHIYLNVRASLRYK